MIADSYELIANLDTFEGRIVTSVFHDPCAAKPVLIVWDSPTGPEMLYLTEFHFFALCDLIQRDILDTYNESDDYLARVLKTRWKEVQAERRVRRNARDYLVCHYQPSRPPNQVAHVRLQLGWMLVQISFPSFCVLPCVASMIRLDWQPTRALTR